MRIVIDIREQELYELFARLPEKNANITIVREDLPIGDIIIQNSANENILIIERKTFPDLLASINDGRYDEQSHRLLHTSNLPPHCIIYLLEGMFSSLREPSQKKKIYSAMTSIQCFKGMSVMRTSSIHETAEWLLDMTDKIHRDLLKGKVCWANKKVGEGEPANYCNVVKKVKKENVTPENIGEIVLSQIPGISSVTALAIMKKFSTFPNLLASLAQDSHCLDDIVIESNGKVRKISKSCIENIKKYFVQST